jgi:hypothetical protein
MRWRYVLYISFFCLESTWPYFNDRNRTRCSSHDNLSTVLSNVLAIYSQMVWRPWDLYDSFLSNLLFVMQKNKYYMLNIKLSFVPVFLMTECASMSKVRGNCTFWKRTLFFCWQNVEVWKVNCGRALCSEFSLETLVCTSL